MIRFFPYAFLVQLSNDIVFSFCDVVYLFGNCAIKISTKYFTTNLYFQNAPRKFFKLYRLAAEVCPLDCGCSSDFSGAWFSSCFRISVFIASSLSMSAFSLIVSEFVCCLKQIYLLLAASTLWYKYNCFDRLFQNLGSRGLSAKILGYFYTWNTFSGEKFGSSFDNEIYI